VISFSVDKSEFLKHIYFCVGIVDNRSTMMVLSHIFVEAKDDKVFLSSTDLESSVYSSLPAKVDSPGSICISGKKLYDVVDKLPEERINLSLLSDSQIEISFSSGKTKIKTLPGEDFPQIPKPQDFVFRTIKSETLLNIISKTSYCVSNDEMRKNLTGLYFDLTQPGKIKAIATDGHRMSLVQEEIENTITESFILPKRATNEIKKFIKESEAVKIGVGRSFFICDNGQTSILSRLIDVKFPDYTQVVPNNTNNNFQIDREKLLQTLQRVAVVLSEKTKGAKITILEKHIEIRSLSETGESAETIEKSQNTQNIEVGFNVKYLIDALNSFESKEVCVSINDEVSPACIYENDADQEKQKAIIMPMRV
tara:strand:- start:11188 stop:12288 length:1101 start_codon:yes stop_codon:yes gene_type:complete